MLNHPTELLVELPWMTTFRLSEHSPLLTKSALIKGECVGVLNQLGEVVYLDRFTKVIVNNEFRTVLVSLEYIDATVSNCVKECLKGYQATPGQKDSEDEVLLSVDEAAQLLKLSRSSIYKFTSRNEIPFMKKAGTLYFNRMELIDFIKTGKRKTKLEILKENDEHLGKLGAKKGV